MTTVHLIFNAHLDPIWLWPWQAGLDAALATCRNACDQLDANPDLTFVRGEAWVYEQIERIDPPLFERIRTHINAGRWEIVNGWYIQPDCNLPSGVGLQKQIEIGKRYFTDRFGKFPRVAYNVDTFGHAASLPAIMHAAGQNYYVMMRPQEHEMPLPARLFRWRGRQDGPQVVTFRIARSYATTWGISLEHIEAALTELPDGIDHTMCFVGVGDHGGGPTRQDIAWLREHWNDIDGAELVFSTPQRFFDAIANRIDALPLVVGELQHHAIGCYSVHRPVKTAVRRAENLLQQAEVIRRHDPSPPSTGADELEQAWKCTAFHHFHDTLGGTCIPSAYEQVDHQLGMACAVADEQIHHGLRRRLSTLADDPLQRIVLCNASDEPFDGYTECEPWLAWQPWQQKWRLLDETGAAAPFQLIDPEASCDGLTRLLLPVQIEPGELRVLRIDRDEARKDDAPSAAATNGVSGTSGRLSNDAGMAITMDGAGRLNFTEQKELAMPRLELFDDWTDTWSHDVDRYPGNPDSAGDSAQHARWHTTTVADRGPLVASIVREGTIGASELLAEWRVYAGESFAELFLRVNWVERHRVLKLTWALPCQADKRLDGIPGDELARPNDGRERPLRDRTLISLADGATIGIVCPDVFALDGSANIVRLTLLRAPLLAHHGPNPGTKARRTYSDRGEHRFRFRFFAGPTVTGPHLDHHALMMQRPPIMADLTRGMK